MKNGESASDPTVPMLRTTARSPASKKGGARKRCWRRGHGPVPAELTAVLADDGRDTTGAGTRHNDDGKKKGRHRGPRRCLVPLAMHLSLENGGLKEFPPKALSNASVTSMDLRGNLLVRVPSLSLPKLVTMDLSMNNICSVAATQDLPSLRTLRLSSNSLVDTPFLESVPSVVELSLSNNSIRSVDSSIAFLRNLCRLSLANNALRRLPNMSSLQMLSFLDVSGNLLSDLSDFPKVLPGPSLQELNLARNEIDNFFMVKYLTCLTNLTDLDLSQNDGLSRCSKYFDAVPFLVFLCPRLRKCNGAAVKDSQRSLARRLFAADNNDDNINAAVAGRRVSGAAGGQSRLSDRLLALLGPGNEKALSAYLRRHCAPPSSEFDEILERLEKLERQFRPELPVAREPPGRTTRMGSLSRLQGMPGLAVALCDIHLPLRPAAGPSFPVDTATRAAIRIQSATRGFLARSRLKHCSVEAELTRNVNSLRSLVLVQQDAIRLLWEEVRQTRSTVERIESSRSRRAVITIQRWWRGYWDRCLVDLLREERAKRYALLRWAAVTIQRAWRIARTHHFLVSL